MKIYKEHHSFAPVLRDRFATVITITDEDTLEAASHYDNACCLNFASHKRPGGGYKAVQHIPMPIKTQEEDLFRRSNLPDIMDTKQVRQHYPLTGVEGIYCGGVQVERDNKLVAHDPYTVSVITVPAVVNPQPEQKGLVRDKVRRILEIAAEQGHEVLILGAWGCGVFNNDPEEIAGLFLGFLVGEFRGVFSEVVFAIPGKESRNHKLFVSVLHETVYSAQVNPVQIPEAEARPGEDTPVA
jgi:uncharacterized protein (TIGR02452 family)